jgi:outer membrane protein assembly factor BamB
MRRFNWLIVVLLAAGTVGAEDWPTFHRDNSRSGIGAEALAGLPSSAWATALDPESVDASPAVVGGRVYAGTAGGSICALSADTGAVVWRTSLGGAVVSSPSVAGGLVVAGSADRCVYALDAVDGKVRWRVRTRGPVVSSPLVVNDLVYCGSMDGRFRCLRLATGETVWQTTEGGGISGAAAEAEGIVYYGDEAGHLLARRAADGKLVWGQQVQGLVVASPVVRGNMLIVPVMSATALSPPKTDCLMVCDRATGRQIWAHSKQSSVLHTPVADDTYVYFATVSGYLSDTELWACRLTDGLVLWKIRLAGVADSSPLLTGTWLVFGNHDGNLYLVDKATGRVGGTVPVGAKMHSSPALSGGRLFIGAQDGKLHCLR